MTDRDGMYVHVTAKGAMSFRMDCQPMSWLRSTMQQLRPSRNGDPISTAFRFRSGAKDPERNTLRNAVINWPDGDEGERAISEMGRCCRKSPKLSGSENLAKISFLLSPPPQATVGHVRRSAIAFV